MYSNVNVSLNMFKLTPIHSIILTGDLYDLAIYNYSSYIARYLLNCN